MGGEASDSAYWHAAIEHFHWDRMEESARLVADRGVGDAGSMLRWLRAIEAESRAATSPEAATAALLAHVCAYLEWPLGHAYVVDPSGERLESSGIWHRGRAGTYERLVEASAGTSFRPGEAPSWYRGYIYNPNNGRTFNSTIHVEEDGSLKVRGFVGVSLFGKTVEWVRPRETLARCS